MKRAFRGFVTRAHARAEKRRERALRQAASEMRLRERNRDGSIWRTGKGGFHHDR